MAELRLNTEISFDIETIPCQSESVRDDIAANISPPGNMSKPETIAAWERDKKPHVIEQTWRKTGLDGALGEVCVISASINDDKPQLFYFDDWKGREAAVIRAFYTWIDAEVLECERAGSIFIGHNIIDFDLRFIFQRSVIHGIKPPYFIPFHSKPWGGRVYDTMTAWAGHGNRVDLEKLCDVLGIDSKGSEIGEDIDGSMVWDFVRDGRISDVAKYCAGDVIRHRELYKRMTFAQ